MAVAAGLVDVVSNRGSLLYNLFFFLGGAYLAPRIRRFTARPRPALAGALILGYLAAYAVMRVTGTETVPGVWPAVSVLGVAMGLAVAPILAGLPLAGRGLQALGVRSLPIYLLHMPLLALADAALVGSCPTRGKPCSCSRPSCSRSCSRRVSSPRASASIASPLAMDSPGCGSASSAGRGRRRASESPLADTGRGADPGGGRPRRQRRGGGPRPPAAIADRAATNEGEVSIGAVGDILLYDASRGIPVDRGRSTFDAVRPWFTEDIVTGNLEQVIAADTGVDKCGGSDHCLAFRSEPDAVEALRGFDVLNQANNHSHDFGREGVDETRAVLRAEGMDAVGDRNEVVVTRVGRHRGPGRLRAVQGFNRSPTSVTSVRWCARRRSRPISSSSTRTWAPRTGGGRGHRGPSSASGEPGRSAGVRARGRRRRGRSGGRARSARRPGCGVLPWPAHRVQPGQLRGRGRLRGRG